MQKYRFKTKEELIRDLGSKWDRHGPCWVQEMFHLLGTKCSESLNICIQTPREEDGYIFSSDWNYHKDWFVPLSNKLRKRRVFKND